MFILLSWCSGIYTICLEHNEHFTSSPAWSPLVGSMATLLDLILDKTNRAKASIQKSALVRTRRALRSVSARLVYVFCVV